MTRDFIKMHGLGNDFVIIDGREDDFLPDRAFCLAVADRHRGVGYDQMIILSKPEDPAADLYMHIYNCDASKVEACGNATRCVARLLFEGSRKTRGVIQTIAGLLHVQKEADGLISVDFPPPRLAWDEIPLSRNLDTLHVDMGIEGVPPACCVNVGNPHAVFFVPDIADIALESIGPILETHTLFPKKCNIEFAHIVDRTSIRMRVWERGAGVTQACGSGATAALIAAVRRGLVERKATIHLDGGDLVVEWREADGHVILSGPAALSFKGTLCL